MESHVEDMGVHPDVRKRLPRTLEVVERSVRTALVFTGASVTVFFGGVGCGAGNEQSASVSPSKPISVPYSTPTSVTNFIESGGDPNALVDEFGNTLLHKAAQIRAVANVRSLVSTGADVNARSVDNDTPLHAAAINGQFEGAPEVASLLIEGGADVNAIGFRGQTPLHNALLHPGPQTPDFIRRLLDAGADETIPDREGKLPIDFVRERAPELLHLFKAPNLTYEGVMAQKSSLEDWTAEEMADCDAAVSKLEPKAPTPQHAALLLDSCNSSIGFRHLQLLMLLEDDDLSIREISTLTRHLDTHQAMVDAMDRVYQDKVVDLSEYVYICSVITQWVHQITEAQRYIESLDRPETDGFKAELIQRSRLNSELNKHCR